MPAGAAAAETAASQLAAGGGSRGAGIAAVAKVLAACVGTAGGAAACVATGVIPNQVDPLARHERPATVKRVADRAIAEERPRAVETARAGAGRALRPPPPLRRQGEAARAT